MQSTVTSQPVSSIQTVTMQPVHGGWMETLVGCPRGLEYLTLIDHLLIKQHIEILEAVIGFETNNKYDIRNSVGQRIYYAEEDSNWLNRIFLGSLRSFDIKIFDNYMVEVIHLRRPLRGCSWCCCCLQEMEVQAPPGMTIGYVRKVCDSCYPLFVLNNMEYRTVLRVKGRSCCFCPCGVVRFEITGLDNTTQVGMITKTYGGLLREALTDANSFTITFPIDLDVKIKATAIGASFLLDFMYFEE